MWSIGRSDPSTEADLPLPLEIRIIRNARRMRLRVDDKRGVLKLTCPPRTSRRSAVRWALEQRNWIDAQLACAPEWAAFEPGAIVPLEGRDIRLLSCDDAPRRGELIGDELRIGGSVDGFARRAEAHLRALATERLSNDVDTYMKAAGVVARSVTVGDAATRWGSCSSSGHLRFSWRLIMAPTTVRQYVAAHEVAHLVHLNHGPDFRRLESELFGPGLEAAKQALRGLGPRLRRIGRRG